jgi:peptidoglycan/LPS O-acetylase OafA/YrhL
MAAGDVDKDQVRDTAGHMPRLDGLRGIAIVLVMFFHLVFFQPACRVDRLFNRFTQYGWTGVDLFFILSGFLITGILLDAKSAPNYFRNFYIRRCLRILPLYYAFALGLIFLYPLAGAHFRTERDILLSNQPWLWTHTINWLVTKTGDFTSRTTLGTGGFWSLSIEEQYYLVWPIIVWFLSRRALLRTCIGLAIFSIIARFVMAQAGCSWAAIYSATFARFDPLAIGGALAVIARTRAGLPSLRRYAGVAAGLGLVGFVMVDYAIKRSILTNGQYILAIQLALLPVLWGSSLVLTQTARPSTFIAAITSAPILRTFGKYSYSLYLFHGHLTILPQGMGFKIKDEWVPKVFGSVLPAQLLYVLVTFAFCLGLSWLSWHFFENRFLKLKRYFPSRREAQRQNGQLRKPEIPSPRTHAPENPAPPVSALALVSEATNTGR